MVVVTAWEVDPVVPGLCEVGPAMTGSCEDPAVAGSCEVGPAETGLARSASCRSDVRWARVRARKEEGGCPELMKDRSSVCDAICKCMLWLAKALFESYY